jgi:hypothetical protein
VLRRQRHQPLARVLRSRIHLERLAVQAHGPRRVPLTFVQLGQLRGRSADVPFCASGPRDTRARRLSNRTAPWIAPAPEPEYRSNAIAWIPLVTDGCRPRMRHDFSRKSHAFRRRQSFATVSTERHSSPLLCLRRNFALQSSLVGVSGRWRNAADGNGLTRCIDRSRCGDERKRGDSAGFDARRRGPARDGADGKRCDILSLPPFRGEGRGGGRMSADDSTRETRCNLTRGPAAPAIRQ